MYTYTNTVGRVTVAAWRRGVALPRAPMHDRKLNRDTQPNGILGACPLTGSRLRPRDVEERSASM